MIIYMKITVPVKKHIITFCRRKDANPSYVVVYSGRGEYNGVAFVVRMAQPGVAETGIHNVSVIAGMYSAVYIVNGAQYNAPVKHRLTACETCYTHCKYFILLFS